MSEPARTFGVVLLYFLLAGHSWTDRQEFDFEVLHGLRLIPDEARQFLHSSPLNFLLGWMFARFMSPEAALNLVNLLGIGAFVAGVSMLSANRYPQQPRLARVLLFNTPVLLVLVAWMGKSDALLLGCYFMLVIARSAGVRFVLALVMTLCHRELAAIILLLHAVLLDRRHIGWMIAGIAAGQLLIFGYLHGYLEHVPQSRLDFAAGRAAQLVADFAQEPVLYLFCMLNGFWMLSALVPTVTRWQWFALLLAMGLSLVTLDHTRIFVLAAMPLILSIIDSLLTDAAILRLLDGAAARPLLAAALLLGQFLHVQVSSGGYQGVFANGWLHHLVYQPYKLLGG